MASDRHADRTGSNRARDRRRTNTWRRPTRVRDPGTELNGCAIPARSLFAVDLAFDPALPSLGIAPNSVFEIAARNAKRQFVEFLEEEGVVENERKSVPFERDDGTRGQWSVLEVSSPVAPSLTPDDVGALDAEAHVVIWPTADSFGVAGGDGSARGIEGVLEIDSERDRETIIELVRSAAFPRADSDGR